MAGTSPRRSVRSRHSHPQNFTPQRSSTSSSTSGRGERTTRHPATAESPRKHSTNDSLSSEPLDETSEESVATRRRKRGQADDQDKDEEKQHSDMSNGLSEPVGEDDEAVRCICGSDEYPGPPQITEEDSKKGIKDGTEPELLAPEDYTEDLAGFFLQCDTCKVWQHGGCVGIKNEDMSPDEYYCELCQPKLHKIYTASNGQKYSHYLPLYQHLSRSTSRAASFSKDGTRSPRSTSKNPRPTSSASAASALQAANAKRRSTMNSRDAAYDEEEQLRRAIAASKGEKLESVDGGSTRRTKRGRSDSEEKNEPSKRQRTLSRSPSPRKHSGGHEAEQDSENEHNGPIPSAKKIRGAAARNHREKELREERERARLEAANKRKGRAERRRVDDSDNGHEPPILPAPRIPLEKAHTVPEVDGTRASAHDTPNNSPPTKILAEKPKKGGRPPHPRKGKAGKNQYTRDADGTPARSASRDVTSRDEPNTENRTSGRLARNDTDSERPHTGRGRPGTGHGNHKGGHKVSMLDMRRRVAGMLDFISRTQLEMAEAGEAATPADSGAEGAMRSIMNGMNTALKAANAEADSTTKTDEEKEKDVPKDKSSEFKELGLLEMMDVLTGELVKWQKAYIT